MRSEIINPVSSFIRKLTRVFLTASLAIGGLAAALPQPVQATPDAPTALVSDMGAPRSQHTASLLHNGKVLVVGGRNGSGVIGSAELYDMTTGRWSAISGVSPVREGHTATTLLNGKVLVVGGSNGTSALNNATLYDPAKGTWSAAANLPTGAERFNHTATLLANGSVLVAGGEDFSPAPVEAAELYNPTNNTWSPAGTLNDPRYGHTASLLPGGWVLVTGGDGETGMLASGELYDPINNNWVSVNDNMSTVRTGHSATVLPDGQVLIAGGDSYAGTLASAELFSFNPSDPGGSTWTDTGAMVAYSRTLHSATLLPNGKVMVVGGVGISLSNPAGLEPLASIELYDPGDGTWTGSGDLHSQHTGHTASLLPTGEVLVAGGKQGNNYLASVEKVDLTVGIWTSIGEMASERSGHSATLLADGKVLVAGGTGTSQFGTLKSAEIYDPAGGWSSTNDMLTTRAYHTATLLPNGKVLVAGGGNGDIFTTGAELYDPQTGSWEVTGALHNARGNHTATLLRNGQVLVVGGLTNNGHYLTSAEMYNPETGSWTQVASLTNARRDHTATLLADGTVLVTGGFSTEGTLKGYLQSSERYNAALNAWQTTGAMTVGRGNHTATLLPDGQVLVTGGLNDGQTTGELYDPLSGSWTITQPMNSGHYFHTAALLPNGKVLVAGGYDESSSPTSICEVYDPATAEWQLIPAMSSARQSFSATILADGRILAVGGRDSSSTLKSVEVYDIGQGFDPIWRPTIDSIPPRIQAGQKLTLSGTNFRGYQRTEASSGSTHGSPSNYPLVQLRRPDNGQVAWLLPDPALGFSATVFHSIPLSFSTGPVIITVYVNGIPSQSVMIQIEAVKTFTPIVYKADPRPYKVRLPVVKR